MLRGDGIWDLPPTSDAQTALEATPEEMPDLAGLLELVAQHGFEVAHGHVSTLEEWDEYEWSWTGSLSRWALDNPGHPGSGTARETAESHRDGWLKGYRGTLGFVTLLLRHS